ncbi:MAG: hypothetical protein Q8M92_00445, partial [Candidatus Subteraquimicrobiales bacterium]|nr:hypothetical protein [Candidatus Subteraquimicrobiales bacterium]
MDTSRAKRATRPIHSVGRVLTAAGVVTERFGVWVTAIAPVGLDTKDSGVCDNVRSAAFIAFYGTYAR